MNDGDDENDVRITEQLLIPNPSSGFLVLLYGVYLRSMRDEAILVHGRGADNE
jgi:hypothetical protein